MSRTRSSDGALELTLRRELWSLGLRYRLQVVPEPAVRHRADIVFKGPRIVVDVRGCYWHACLEHGSWPKANAGRWREKLLRNRERDAETVKALQERGWIVFVVWQHDDFHEAARAIRDLVHQRSSGVLVP